MIILDDFQSTSEIPTSRIYENPILYLEANHFFEVSNIFKKIEQERMSGHYVVVAISYDIGYELFEIEKNISRDCPLIRAWVYGEIQKVDKDVLNQFISQKINKLPNDQRLVGLYNFNKNVSEQDYLKNIDLIKEYIRSGTCYQINFTYLINGNYIGHPLALYQNLKEKFLVNYGAYVHEDASTILSFSPELFISKKGSEITALPMKGTASAVDTSPEELASDEKNRAENVMIVDLLRNDLSKVAKLGSVKVKDLFKVSRYGDVLQMTSTVKALVDDCVTLEAIIKATYPCGSITGAPKKKSIELIGELEREPRGIYCGSIGWLDPSGDFTLNVAIRTMTLDSSKAIGNFKFGVGSGVTIDSNGQDEWDECKLKTNFLRNSINSVNLFETLRIQNGVALRLKEHIDRLTASAAFFNYKFDMQLIMLTIEEAIAKLDKRKIFRLKLTLDSFGVFDALAAEMEDLPLINKVFWADDLIGNYEPIDSNSEWVKHKTSNRQIYDTVWQAAVDRGGFDGLLLNQKGFVVEGGRSSIFIKPNNSNVWLTPPLGAGLLPGIMRANLLKNRVEWNILETNITKQDVVEANELMLTNSLRGIVLAKLG